MLDAIEAQNRPWYDKTWLVVVLCIVFFPVGVYALWKNTKISIGWKVAVSALITIAVLSNIFLDRGGTNSASSQSDTADNVVPTAVLAEVGVGDVLETEYFDIRVNKVSLQDSIDTGNPFTSIPSEPGVAYVVINATFTNTDVEGRMLMEGSLLIEYKDKTYEYDNSEVILGEGWGLFLDQLNPLMTKSTNIVYKIPADINGRTYWRPGRAATNETIFLGNLK